jgi:hypothetical protein
VACLLAGSRRHAAAAVAADVAHLVAHLVLPVSAAALQAARRAVCSIDQQTTRMILFSLLSRRKQERS